ncbi:MAG: FecCD family ABC transporter permease [Peptococcia bacterium]|jgi:iron complex transport system permease protein
MNIKSTSMNRRRIAFLGGLLLLFFSGFVAVSYGSVQIPFAEIMSALKGTGDEASRNIIFYLRLPRVVEAAFVGAGLAVVGAFFQGLLRNPLSDPYILGVSSGAALGATIAILLSWGIFGIGCAAFVAALLTIHTVYLIARSGTRLSVTSLLLGGIAISTFLSAFISLLMLLNHEQMARIFYWTMGSFNLVFWDKVLFSAPLIFLGCLVIYFFARDLNVIMTGEETAEHLGIDTEKVKRIILLLGSLITAAAVSVVGIIGFVGLIVPHMARLLVGPDNRVLVPFSALCGAVFLIWTDLFARTILAPAEIPVGIITAALGGPFFIYLLIKAKTPKKEG